MITKEQFLNGTEFTIYGIVLLIIIIIALAIKINSFLTIEHGSNYTDDQGDVYYFDSYDEKWVHSTDWNETE